MPGRLSDARGPVAAGAAADDPARLADEYGLGAYARTQTDKDYPLGRGCGLVLVPIAVVFIPSAVIPFVDGRPGDVQFGLIWAPLIGCLLVAGVLALWRSPARRVVRTFWYSDGLIQLIAHEPEPRVIRWDRVISLTVRIVRADETPDYIGSATICDGSGTCLTTRGPALARKATQILTPTVVPPLISAFDAGEPVTFGRMRIDRSGITDAGRPGAAEPVFAAWSDIRRISFDARVSIRIWTANRKAGAKIDLEDVPNGFFAHHVIEHAAAQAGVPVEYYEEKRLPPRPPVRAGP